MISSLATYAMVNDLGFIETAYRPVEDGKIKDEVVFLMHLKKQDQFIAQADAARNSEDTQLKAIEYLRVHQGNFLIC